MGGPVNDAPMKIAYVSSVDPRDRRSWSGAHYYIIQALQKHCGEVSCIGPLSAPLLLRRILNAVDRLIHVKTVEMAAAPGRLHFGLGGETQASLEIRWPNGKEEKLEEVAADQLVVIREGSGIIRKESFARRPAKN